MFQDLTSLVVDVGTYSTKIGFGGDDAPKITSLSYVGQCPSEMVLQGQHNQGRFYVGEKYFNLEKPDMQIESIFKTKKDDLYELDYDKYEQFLGEHFNALHVNLKDYSILISEDMINTQTLLRQQRSKIAEIMFEKFNVANIFFIKNPVLSCFATGRSTALVLDSGETYTRAIAVHDGYALNKSLKIVPIGGKTISTQIKKHIQSMTKEPLKTRKSLQTSNKYRDSYYNYHIQQLLRDIKQHISYKPNQQNAQQITQVQYQLPDKNQIVIDKTKLPDLFINPQQFLSKSSSFHHLQTTYKGFPQMVVDNINACDIDIKKQLYANILFTGGNMLYGNIIQDTLNKITQYAPPNAKIRSVAMCMPAQRKYTEWMGGSIVTSLSAFQSYWVGNLEYKQLGSQIIDKKCV